MNNKENKEKKDSRFEEKFNDNVKRHEKLKKEVEYYQDILSTEDCVESALKKIKGG